MAEKKKRKPPGVTYKEWVSPDNLLVVSAMCRDGARSCDIAEFIGVCTETLKKWKGEHAELAEAMRKTADIVDYEVENALLKRCLGFHYKETKKLYKNGDLISTEEYQKYMPPDVTACAIWLNNRKPDEWKRNRDNYTITENESGIQINIVRAGDKKRNATNSKGEQAAEADS